MDSSIPQHHPLRSLFETLTERAFTEKLGWPDFTPGTGIARPVGPTSSDCASATGGACGGFTVTTFPAAGTGGPEVAKL